MFRVLASLAFVLVPIRFASGVASPRPRRASKRLDCRLWKHGRVFIKRTERARCQTKTSRYKALVPCSSLVANSDWFDAFLHWNSAAEEGACLDLKLDIRRRHRKKSVQGPVLDPRAKETCKKGVRKRRRLIFAPAFSSVLRQKRVTSLSYCFASISTGLRPSRPASKPASKACPEKFCSNSTSRDTGVRDLH